MLQTIDLFSQLIARGFDQYKIFSFSDNALTSINSSLALPITPKQLSTLTDALIEEKAILIATFPIPIDTRTEETFSNPKNCSIKELTAPFAQINYYNFITRQFKEIIQLIKPRNMPKSQFRIFSNSNLPEKFLAIASGLCTVGKNNLLISDSNSNSFLVGGFIFPKEILVDVNNLGYITGDTLKTISPIGSKCGSCSRCIDHCPTNALSQDKSFIKEKCLQYYSHHDIKKPTLKRPHKFPIFYGCTECQTSCPRHIATEMGIANRNAAIQARTPSLPSDITVATLLELPENKAIELLTAKTKKTALAPKWLEKRLLLRNLKKI